MKKFITPVVTLCVLLNFMVLAQADDAIPQWQTDLKAKLTATLSTATSGQLMVVNISETPLANLVEIELSTGEFLFSDKAGDFLFTGDMFATTATGLRNLSAEKRQVKNANIIAGISREDMIIFSPDVVKGSVTVFTDVDCTYCRKLHGDIDKLLELGVEVKYVAYPRGGEKAASYQKMISVWCAKDRNQRLTQAKNGQNIPAASCDSPVLELYELGNQIGISGTPALVLASGRVIPGYIEPQALAELLVTEK